MLAPQQPSGHFDW